MILLLLDTGIRASEMCNAKIHDLDQRNSRIHVFGKGSKERYIPFSGITGQAIWRYLATRPAGIPSTEPLFTNSLGMEFVRSKESKAPAPEITQRVIQNSLIAKAMSDIRESVHKGDNVADAIRTWSGYPAMLLFVQV